MLQIHNRSASQAIKLLSSLSNLALYVLPPLDAVHMPSCLAIENQASGWLLLC